MTKSQTPRLRGSFRSHALVERLRSFLVDAPDEHLFHIDPGALAGAWGVSRRVVLELFLRAVRFGVFNLEWAFHCPTCGGVARESLQLAHTHEQNFCPVCRIDFRNTLDDTTTNGVHDWRTDATISGVEVLNHPAFREVFGDDKLPMDQSLEIRSATILFTDVTGSTAMYERIGDAGVREVLRERVATVQRMRVSMKGIDGLADVYRASLPEGGTGKR